jgi:DNA-binding CsgD family transcriptional regulator/tetratricopeptide (TPR) repeat protein
MRSGLHEDAGTVAGDALSAARAAFDRREWAAAHDGLARLDHDDALGPADLERLAMSADMLGRLDEGIAVLRRVFAARLHQGETGRALRAGYWLTKSLQFRGNTVQSSAWQARTCRLAEESPECPEGAYALLLEAEAAGRSGRREQGLAAAREALALATGSQDADLRAATHMAMGMGLVENGALEQGLAELDEAMESATEGQLSPRATGLVYCVVIGACQAVHDVGRARAWTAALASWCETQPEFTGGYRGLCLVHRVEVLQLGGAWSVAMAAAEEACTQLGEEGFLEVVAGAAHHRVGELHRLRGEYAAAEVSFREAMARGWEPQPGLALLWLATGRVPAAGAAIRRALTETTDRLGRSRLLPVAVEVFLAEHDADAAAAAADELDAIAGQLPMPSVQAMAGHARGAVLLESGDAAAALPLLRRAWRRWRDLDAPYEAARTRVLVARSCRLLGDEDSAVMELDAARQAFVSLGARPDVAVVDRLLTGAGGPLSPREREVLRLVAVGRSNHEIATELVLSERTVARHVSNILAKLQVPSRTAAAAYAFEHALL